MRILVAGNLANTGYYLVSKLRSNGFNSDLLMEENPEIMSDPKSTGELNDMYPAWIKFLKKRKKSWKWNTIKIMRKYDVVVAATEFPIFSLFSFKPFIAIATGSDLRELARSNSYKGLLLRLAYKKAKKVIFTDPDLLQSVRLLKLKNAIYLPPVRDFSKINTIQESNSKDEKFVFFHPTNHIWDVKHNDLFIRAFIELARKKNNVFLILINKGKDFQKSLKLLKEADMEDKFSVLEKPLNQTELFRYYQKSNAVVDQFKIGSLGSIGLEGMNFSKPVIAYIDKGIYEACYEEIPPILSSKNQQDLLKKLEKLVDDQNFAQKIGIKSKEWMEKFHSSDLVIKKYSSIIKAAFNEKFCD